MRPHTIEVFYDGDCPLCSKEINWLKKRDKESRVLYTDLTKPDFVLPEGYSEEQLMLQIHGRLADGTIIHGVPVFDHMYAASGLNWLVTFGKLPIVRPLMNLSYAIFAKFRLPLTGRKMLGKSCRIPS